LGGIGPTRGFSGWPIQWNHAKCRGADSCCHGLPACCCCSCVPQPTGLRYCLFIAVILLVPVILSLCASSLALLLLAANQYLAICNPLFAQTRCSPGRAGLCIVAAWLTSATAAALPAMLLLMLHYSDESRVCTDYTNSMANKSLEVCCHQASH